jgi:hypothetical protein
MMAARASSEVTGACGSIGGSTRENIDEWKLTSVMYYPTTTRTWTRTAGRGSPVSYYGAPRALLCTMVVMIRR